MGSNKCARGRRVANSEGGGGGSQYDAAFVKSPVEQVAALVDVYNQSAWERRKVHVTFRPVIDPGAAQRSGYELLVEAL